MMQSQRQPPRSLRRWVVDHPFLCVAILAGLIFGAMQSGLLGGAAASTAWQILGFGFHATTNALARWLPDIPGWLETAMVAVIGLMPYLMIDAVWRFLKPG